MIAALVAGAALVLAGGTVVDGYGNAPIPDGIVVIDGERILAVGGVGQVAIPEGAEIVSTEGMTVLPGLWDMQADLMRLGHGDSTRWNETYGPLAERVVMPIAARQLLAAGVTSARDVAAPIDAAVHVRGRVRERIIDGPTLYVSGPALRKLAPAGTGAWQWEVNGGPDVRAKVQRLAGAGVDYLLLADLGMWTAEELEAVVSEARLRGLPVHAFAEQPADVVRGAAAQLDGFLGTAMGAAPFPAEVMQALSGRLTQAGARPIAWSPAISAVLNLAALQQNREPLDDPRAIAELPDLVATDIKGSLASLDRIAATELPVAAAPSLCEKLRQLDQANVLLLVGSGAGAPGHLHSRATWQEIDFWVRQCGIPATRAIRAATHDAATAMGVGHESGAISPGKIADIIAVRGDVLRDPGLLQSVDIVIKRGRRVR
jgi:imidazolonepropionase-like amidohydrolase